MKTITAIRVPKYKATKPKTFYVREDEQVYGLRTEGDLPKSRPSFKLIDLFCGAGGMTLGFTEPFGHHFKPVWANDFNEYCVETYKANFGNHCIGRHCGDAVQSCH